MAKGKKTSIAGGKSVRRAGADIWKLLAPASGGRKAKISVTVDEGLWEEVQALVDKTSAAETVSAAVERSLAMWLANQRLAMVLDELYEQDPDARPTAEEVARAATVLDL